MESPRGEWQAVCGYVYNDRYVLVRDVRLLIQGRDASGRVVSSRAGQVVGDVAPSGRIPFCLMAEAGAAQYSVRLLDARSAPAGGQ